MSEAPERIYTCTHVGEYGNYYPETVEAEGEYGGLAQCYIRADLHDAAQAAIADLRAQLEAADAMADDLIRGTDWDSRHIATVGYLKARKSALANLPEPS